MSGRVSAALRRLPTPRPCAPAMTATPWVALGAGGSAVRCRRALLPPPPTHTPTTPPCCSPPCSDRYTQTLCATGMHTNDEQVFRTEAAPGNDEIIWGSLRLRYWEKVRPDSSAGGGGACWGTGRR